MWDHNRYSYGREGRLTPASVWILQRISAALLGPVVLAHVTLPRETATVWLDVLLLVLVLSHGAIGLWRLASAPGLSRTSYGLATVSGAIVVAVLAVVGLAIAFSPS